MQAPLTISASALRRLAAWRIVECLFWFPVLIGLGVAILSWDYRFMFFSIVAFGIALVPLAYAVRCVKQWRGAADCVVDLQDKVIGIAEWTEPVNGAVMQAETHRAYVRLFVTGTGVVDLPIFGPDRDALVSALTGAQLSVEPGDGTYKVLGFALGGVAMVIASMLLLRVVTWGVVLAVLESGSSWLFGLLAVAILAFGFRRALRWSLGRG